MHNQHQLNLPPTPVQKVSRAGEIAAPVEGKEVSLTGLLAESVDETGYPDGNAARDMGYEPAYWSRIKSGEKAAHLERVSRLPVRVQREYVKRWGKQLGMHVSDEDAKVRALKNLVCAAADALREVG